MGKRYAKSYGDNVVVVYEYCNPRDNELYGLYISEKSGKIIFAKRVYLNEDGDIEYWGSGSYGMTKKYGTAKDWLESLRATIMEFEDNI